MTAQTGADRVPIVVERAEVLLEVGRGEDALGLVREALADQVDEPRLHLTAAWVCLHLRRPHEALRHAERGVALAPAAAGAHLLLSIALLDVNERQRARAAVERSLALNPDDASAHSHLARVLLAGRPGAADKWLARAASDRALELAPDAPALLLAVAGYREELGDTDGARDLILRGLATAPADEDLLVAQARISAGTGGLSGVLADNPLHVDARILLHHRVWQQYSGLADLAVLVGSFALVVIGWVMSDRGIVFAPVWGVVLMLLLGVGSVRRARRLWSAPRSYVVRSLRQSAWPTRAGVVLAAIGLLGTLAVVLSLFVVADPVSARRLVVLAAVVVLVSGVSGALLLPASLEEGRSQGLYPPSQDGDDWFVRQQRTSRTALLARAVIVAVLAVIVIATMPLAGRTDALEVALLGGAMYVLPTVAAWWKSDQILRARSATVAPLLGVPARAVLVASAAVVLLVGVAGLVRVPVVAGAHDEHGRYVTPPSVIDDEPVPCVGSTGLPCGEGQFPFGDLPNDPPTIDVPTFDVPDLDLDFDQEPTDPDANLPGSTPPPAPAPDPGAPVTAP